MQDDLFTPTIREAQGTGRPPWRPESIIYPAFFGGPLAAATLGVLNGRRLALPAGMLITIAAAGLAGFAARMAISANVDGTSVVRFAANVTGLLVWLVVMAFQRRRFRAFTYGNGEPASLVGPGFAAAIGGAVLEAVVIFGLVR